MTEFTKEEAIHLLDRYRRYAKVQGTTEFGLEDFLKKDGVIEEFEMPLTIKLMDESIEKLIKLRATLKNLKI